MKVVRPKLTLLEKLYAPQIIGGLLLTFKHIFRKKVTMQYPEEQPKLFGPYRGVPTLVRDPDGRVKCVSCQLCEFVCPPKAIRITPGFRAATGPGANAEKEPQEFQIDMLRCIYCGLCQEACPEEAIFLRQDFAVTGYSREEMVFNKAKLLELGGTQNSEIWKWKNK